MPVEFFFTRCRPPRSAPTLISPGRLPQQTIDEFKEAGFFRVFVPKRYGGFELDYGLTQVELCNQIGRGCGSSAWVFSVAAIALA